MNVFTSTHLLLLLVSTSVLASSSVSAFLTTKGARQPFHVNVKRWSSNGVAPTRNNNVEDVYEIDAMGRIHLASSSSTSSTTTSTKEKDETIAFQTEAVLKEAAAMTAEEIPTIWTVADLSTEETTMDVTMEDTPTVTEESVSTSSTNDNDDSMNQAAAVVAAMGHVLQTHPLVETKEEAAVVPLEEEVLVEVETVAIENEPETIEYELVALEAEAVAIEDELAAVEAEAEKIEAEAVAVEDEIVSVEAEAAAVAIAVEAEAETIEDEPVTIEDELVMVEAEAGAVAIVVEAEAEIIEDELETIEDELVTVEAEARAVEAEPETIEEESTTIDDELAKAQAEAVAVEAEPAILENDGELPTTVEALQQELLSQRKLLQRRIDYFQNLLHEWQQESQAELTQTKNRAKEDQLVWEEKLTTLQEQMEGISAELESELGRSADLERDQKESTVAYSKLEKDFEQQLSHMAKENEIEQIERTNKLVDQVQREAETRVQATLDKAIQDVIEAKKYGSDQLRQRENELAKEKSRVKAARKTMRRMADEAQELEDDRNSLRKLARHSWQLAKARIRERASKTFKRERNDNIFSR